MVPDLPVPTVRAALRHVVCAGVAGAGLLGVGACSASPSIVAVATPGSVPSGPASSARTSSTGSGSSEVPDSSERPGRSSTPSTTEDSTDDSSVADRPDACELLTRADASDAFDEPVTPGTASADECWWSTENDLKTVNLRRRDDEDLEVWRSGFDNDSWSPIDLGDEGYSGKVFDSISWRYGTTTYELNVIYSTSGDPESVLTDLAAIVDAKL